MSPSSSDITRSKIPLVAAIGAIGAVLGGATTVGILYQRITSSIDAQEKLSAQLTTMSDKFDASIVILKSQMTDLREQQIRSDERLKWVAERIDRIEKGNRPS